jgi:hypothetical protein
MREDMAKVIVERPQTGGQKNRKGHRQGLKNSAPLGGED